MHKVVLLRHGESAWSKENRFTGWTDVDLSLKGQDEERQAGIILRERDSAFDIAYTSVLKRAIRTLWIALDEMDLVWMPVVRSWGFNERHYAELKGRIAELESALESAEKRATRGEYALERARASAATALEANREMAQHIRILSDENEALEDELRVALACTNHGGACGHRAVDAESSLCGRRILYVGGRSNLVQHYRALVERLGGELVHHDASQERSLDTVTRTMLSVDAVVCPTDCVSYGACERVKKACRSQAKPFIPLRSAGLSSLARAIQEIPSVRGENLR